MYIIGILLAIALVIFLVFTGISVNHAARFRYLSPRTVYLTVFFVSACSILVLLSFITFGIAMFN